MASRSRQPVNSLPTTAAHAQVDAGIKLTVTLAQCSKAAERSTVAAQPVSLQWAQPQKRTCHGASREVAAHRASRRARGAAARAPG